MFRKVVLTCSALSIFFGLTNAAEAQKYSLSSPDGELQAEVFGFGLGLSYSISKNGQPLLTSAYTSITLETGSVPEEKAKPVRESRRSEDSTITPPVAIKNSTIRDQFNELTLEYENGDRVVFRAYDDAIAHRFETNRSGEIVIKHEFLGFAFPTTATAWFAKPKDWFHSYEHVYLKEPIGALGDDKTQLPLLVDIGEAGKLLITETDLIDYPGLYLTGFTPDSQLIKSSLSKINMTVLKSIFPPAVKSEQENDPAKRGWDRAFRPAERYDYIAKTSGTRTFPWRIIAVAEKDTDLLNNEIVYKLAAPSKIADPSWIKPGLVAWDWWNNWNLTGVDFVAGPNTETYKYFIDFASRNGIPYIMMDEGWYELGDIMKPTDVINVPEIVNYAKSKNVDVILWTVWRTLDNKMDEAMAYFQEVGVKGIKVDFMDRDDQEIVNFYWRCAEKAAQHQLLVDFHGSHKPAGIQRTWPNVVNFEGVPGLEYCKWSDSMTSPPIVATIPYIRMAAGPMDYTPGALRNAQKIEFRPIRNWPMSYGTRCQQLAEFIIFDAPLQMLADSPTEYEKEPETLEFIADMPTTWEQTIPLDGKVGEYVVMARKKGEDYFAAALTDWDKRELTLDCSFLPEGEWQAVIFQDGVNAHRNGTDFKKVTRTVRTSDKLQLNLAPGGGWAARFTR